MKFKGLTKLAMSGVALAAVAATLGTSTYAWYVTNSTATATNIQASTKKSDGSNLLVSLDGSNFSSKVVFTSENYDVRNYITGNNGDALLTPVTVDGSSFSGNFITYDEKLSSSSSSSYVKFHLWVKASENISSVTTTLTADNTTESLPTQKAYYKAGSSAITAGQTFTVDAMQALRTAIVVNAESGATAESNASAATITSSNVTVYDTLKIAKNADNTSAYSPLGSVTAVEASEVNYVDASGASQKVTLTGAHAYYTAVMAQQPAKVEDSVTVSSSTTIANMSLSADIAVRLDFYIWLEGSDTFCFDACGGQTFNFGLIFSK
jgi:hypothetical protein